MASLLNSESRRLYSWWWDSHNTPKNSKWLHENLTDMDDKVKTMIKLIEEDADSFARKAEMYYKKRPELMKLVEEFYRAYRALAERYDHATAELRHAHRTLAKAFPDQIPLELIDDSSSESSAQEMEQAMRFVDDLLQKKIGIRSDNSEGGLKELLGSEVEWLKKALADLQTEKEGVLQQYQQCMQKLGKMEEKLNIAQEESVKFNEKATLAEIEVRTLNEALIQLETEKNAELIKHQCSLDKISHLETMTSQLQKDMNNRAIDGECEAQNLKDEISRLHLEKLEMFHLYEQCLVKISDLENVVSVKEDETIVLKEQAERAEAEVSQLKKGLNDLNMEKEASAQQYKCCLETISKLEKDLATAKDDVKRLNNEVLLGNATLKTVEGKCTRLELSNHTLRVEAENLAKKIASKDQELLKKHEELEKLQSCLQDHEHVEAALQTLQNLHSRSQDGQKALALELENAVKVLKDMEVSKTGLEEEIQQVRNENQSLNQANLSSAVSMEKMQSEILSLREIKEKLERKVSVHLGICNSLQKEILSLKEEIDNLDKSHRGLIEQLKVAGLNPECIATSVKSLQDENSLLKETCEEQNEKAILLKKVEETGEEVTKKTKLLESSLTELQESCQVLHKEKASLVNEKSSLLSQLEAITENMQSLLEKNAVLENTLSTDKVELEGLREKSKGLEEICELLKSERLYLLTERDSLVAKLEHVEKKLENMEQRYMGLEEKYASLQKEKEAMHCHVDKLGVALGIEKQERTIIQNRSDNRLAGLENQIQLLQEENRWKKKESEEELEKSLKAQFELSVLHKFIKDMEEKNYSLIVECQRHVEASKLAERLISELESESLEQQVESELLLDEIERLRLGIYQIFRSLETAPGYASLGKVENERAFTHHILENIEDMKCSISKHEDEKQKIVVENSVLLALLKELESKGLEIVLQKLNMEQEFNVLAEKFAVVNNDKDELKHLNKQLEMELASCCAKQADLHRDYDALQEAYYRVNQENESVLLEFLATTTQSEVLRGFETERVAELTLLLEDLSQQYEVNHTLEKEAKALREKLDLQTAEGLALKDAVLRLDNEVQEMNQDLENSKGELVLTEAKLLDAERKCEAAEEMNLSLARTVTDLRNDLHDSHQIRENLETDLLHLSGDNRIQKEEIESLQMVNKRLKTELEQLHQEIEENTMRELTLNTELEEMNNEFEVYETEASSFCFDLQVSSIQEVLLKNKVQELTRACRTLENDRTLKSLEFEQMKGKVCSMENEISGLKSRLSAYSPVVAALQDEIMHLEDYVLPQNKHKAIVTSEPELPEDQSLVSLTDLQMRVKEVRKTMEEINKGQAIATGGVKQLTSRHSFGRDKNERSRKKGQANGLYDSPKLSRNKSRTSETRSGLLMKDIPLDHVSDLGMLKKGSLESDDLMVGLWEIGESPDNPDKEIIPFDRFENVKAVESGTEPVFTYLDMEKELGMMDLPAIKAQPDREVSDKKILERLASDAKKLEILQSSLDIMREKWESSKKKNRKLKDADSEVVDDQLLEAEDALVQLIDLNGQLVNHIELCPQDDMASPRLKETVKTWRMKVMEQADKGAERIGCLQLELQKIQFNLLKVMDDKKTTGRNRFFRNRNIVLRDFVYNGRKNSGRRKKAPDCVCFRQSGSENVNGR